MSYQCSADRNPVYSCNISILTGTVHPESYYDVFLHVVPIALTNMTCTGDVNTISECSYDEVDADYGCTHREDIIVGCYGK